MSPAVIIKQPRWSLWHRPGQRGISVASWVALLLFAGLYLWWFGLLHQSTNTLYAHADQRFEKSQLSYTQSVGLVSGEPAIILMKERPFRVGTPWVYVADSHPLPTDYQPRSLVKIDVAHTVSQGGLQLAPQANRSLEALFAAAEKAGHSLMASSAYRSIGLQQAVLDSYSARIGASAAHDYVANPGASEHHTGFAVDVDDASQACRSNVSRCSLSLSTADWLADAAPEFGFIIRYPAGKKHVTGIAHEPWHLRYIGSAAPVLTASGLTLDEFVQQVDPTMAK